MARVFVIGPLWHPASPRQLDWLALVIREDPASEHRKRSLLHYALVARTLAEKMDSTNARDFADPSTREWILKTIVLGGEAHRPPGRGEPDEWKKQTLTQAHARHVSVHSCAWRPPISPCIGCPVAAGAEGRGAAPGSD